MQFSKLLLLTIGCATVAPLLMAPGDPACPQCGDIPIGRPAYEILELSTTHYDEFAVLEDTRYVFKVVTLSGQARGEVVPFAEGAGIDDLRCTYSASETLCTFVVRDEGLLGVAIEPAKPSRVRMEFAKQVILPNTPIFTVPLPSPPGRRQ